MNSYDDMALFALVVQAGSFTVAAQKTGVPLSTVSRRISEYEVTLGAKLLDRTTRRLELTSAGKVYLKYCQEVINQGALAKQALENLKDEPEGHIMGASPFPNDDDWGTSTLAKFLKNYPKITLAFNRSVDPADMDKRDLDMMIWIGESPNTTHVAHRLGTTDMMLVGSAAYHAEHGFPKTPQELCHHQQVSYTDMPWRSYAAEGFRYMAFPCRFESDEAITCRHSATQGLGLAYLPNIIIQKYLKRGALMSLLPECNNAIPIWLILSRKKQATRKLEVLIQHLVREGAKSAPWQYENQTLVV